MLYDRLMNHWDEFLSVNVPRLDIQRFIKQIEENTHGESGSDVYWGDMHTLLEDCIQFDIDNVDRYWDSLPFEDIQKQGITKTFPNVRPQFPFMWSEFSNHLGNIMLRSEIDGDLPVKRWGVITEHYTSEETERLGGEDLMFFSHVFAEGLDLVAYMSLIAWSCSPEGILNPKVKTLFPQDESSEVAGMMRRKTLSTFMAISLMHCKNVVITEAKPPDKLNESRVRRGRRPLVTFKTLEVKPVGERKKYLEGNKTDRKMPLHIVRGHFKDFSRGTGRGLFGKAHGMYWWEAHTKGDLKEGLVVKDYKVHSREG